MFDSDLIYLDNHATTRCDPRVVEAMLPMLTDNYGNVHSTSHIAGRAAAEAYERAADSIAKRLGSEPDELVFTSGATESNNLAILGYCLHPRQKRRHVITAETEHPAVLDPMGRLERSQFRVTRLPVVQQGAENCGQIRLEDLAAALDDDTALVSIMSANNEIGTLQDLSAIAALCHQHGAVLHSDATQGVGRIPVNVDDLDVDLLSASAHKFYGPKGVGLLFVRRRGRRVRILPLVEGGGQQHGLRSGTLNTSGVVAMARALEIAEQEMEQESERIDRLAGRLWNNLKQAIPELRLNGPSRDASVRLKANVNVCFPAVEGETLMAACPTIAVSSGSACSSVDPRPSPVLRAIGLTESEARRSLRFGIGRFNSEAEIDQAASLLAAAHARYLRP
jgi:cysteine desulfurase